METFSCRIGELLWKTARKFRDIAENETGAAAARPLSSKEAVMEAVFAHPDGVMLKDIAGEIGRSASAVSQTIETLVRENLVERVVSKKDRRAVVVFPTAKGRERRSEYLGRLNKAVAEALAGVAPDERAACERVLDKIAETVSPRRAATAHSGGKTRRRG